MDNAELNDLILNVGATQFWIVQWGDPDHSPDEDTQVFNLPAYEQRLPKNPTTMRVGDILFVHRIHISKIIFVAEVLALPRKATEEESRKEPWLQRWQWSVSTKNLTPTYGAYWKQYEVKAFDLAKEYNRLNPQQPVSIRTLHFGNYVRVSEDFAKFWLNEIIRLYPPVARKR